MRLEQTEDKKGSKRRLPSTTGPGKAPTIETTTTPRAIPGHLQQTGDRSTVPSDWTSMKPITNDTNRLRLRLADNIMILGESLDVAMANGSSDKRGIACAKTKLDECRLWANDALPEQDE